MKLERREPDEAIVKLSAELAQLRTERDGLAAELDRWRSLYGADDPHDGVVASAAGKLVAAAEAENARLTARCGELIALLQKCEKFAAVVRDDNGWTFGALAGKAIALRHEIETALAGVEGG